MTLAEALEVLERTACRALEELSHTDDEVTDITAALKAIQIATIDAEVPF